MAEPGEAAQRRAGRSFQSGIAKPPQAEQQWRQRTEPESAGSQMQRLIGAFEEARRVLAHRRMADQGEARQEECRERGERRRRRGAPKRQDDQDQSEDEARPPDLAEAGI